MPTIRKFILGYVAFLGVLLALFGANKELFVRSADAYYHRGEDGIAYGAKVEGKDFYIWAGDEEWEKLFVTGVNLGAAKPGYFPGDFGITREDYLRWFEQIQQMNVNTIRVYVAQQPVFYQAFEEYNATARQPLYLMHGVYLNEADIHQYEDAFANEGKIKDGFLRDIRNVIDIVHGNAVIAPSAGNAAGIYTADVSRYVTGWILGIEWEAPFVTGTNENNPGVTSYEGEYIYARNVSPFEVMLAEAADTAVRYETEKYSQQRPLAMSNWVTSDPLNHPGEPNPEREDAVVVDMENLKATERFKAGLFASYHVYPYYPDFFNYEEKYMQDEPINTYKAYLQELNAHHTMPVLISEVGLPASRGITHENIHSGFNQGHLSEVQQGEMLVSLVGDIYGEDMMGAIIFTWQDEWFKRTWNTEDLDIADRRPYWMDYQTNEQNFGILSFEPGKKESVSYVDGDVSEWDDDDLVVRNGDYALYMKSDEKFVYLMVEGDFENQPIYIPIDTIPGQGNTSWLGTQLPGGADFMLVLNGPENSTLLVDAYYDATYYMYGYGAYLPLMARNEAYEQNDSGYFVPITLMLDRGWTLPETGQVIPYRLAETGALRYGMGNPQEDGYDSLADFYHSGGATEIRLPWLLLNVSDPSSGKILDNFYKEGGAITHREAGPFGVGIYTADTAQSISYGSYVWQRWEMPQYHERLKQSYAILQDYFANLPHTQTPQRDAAEIFWQRWNVVSFSKVATWFPIQPVLNYAIAFLLSVILYSFAALMVIHLVSAIRTRTSNAVRRRVEGAVEGEVLLQRDAGGRLFIPGVRRPFSRRGLVVLTGIMKESDANGRQRLAELLGQLGYKEFVQREIGKTRDMEYLILLVRMIGYMRIRELGGLIVQVLYRYDNVELHYQGLLSLSLMARHTELVDIFLDESFEQRLSFRSLREILKVYTGDKQFLYRALVYSPNPFMQSICIKRIGLEDLRDLAYEVFPFLDSEDRGVMMDAVRTLGQLRYQPAAQRIAPLLLDKQWEMRALAVTALGQIDLAAYEDDLVKALGDSEWYVRYNAAKALSRSANLAAVMQKVEKTNDRYAMDMLRYMQASSNIWGDGDE